MSSDLEAEIRDALRSRARGITADDLGRDEPQPRRRTMPAALAVAAVVAALAIGIAVAARPGSSPGRQPAAGIGGRITGIDWRLVKGTEGTTHFTAPGRPAGVFFSPHEDYLVNDSVNSISGRYRRTPSGLHLSPGASTAVGYVGHDPNVLATQAAFASLTGGRVDVKTQVTGSQLVLSGPGFMLWFRDAGTTTIRLKG